MDEILASSETSSKTGARKLVFLILLCGLQFAALYYYVDFFSANSYLPTPFIFDKHDTFMDFFHPLFWATQDNRYSDWGSVYPPLNFIVLKLLRLIFMGADDFPDAFALRQEAGALQIFIVAVYACAPAFVVTRSYWKQFSAPERALIYIAAVCSAPLLFALERGNLIIFSFFLWPFLFSRSMPARAAALALLVNLKPYFILLLLVPAIKKNWDELIMALGATGFVYLATGVLLGSDPLAIPMNLFSFQNYAFSPREILAMPSSLSAFSYVLDSDVFQNSRWSDMPLDPALTGLCIELVKWGLLAWLLAALVKANETLPLNQAFVAVLVMITNLGISVGGYTLVLYFIALPVFNEMRLRKIYIALIALMALPLDLCALVNNNLGDQMSYLSGDMVYVKWTLGAGSILRPALNSLLLMALAFELMKRPSYVMEEPAKSNRSDARSRPPGMLKGRYAKQ